MQERKNSSCTFEQDIHWHTEKKLEVGFSLYLPVLHGMQ